MFPWYAGRSKPYDDYDEADGDSGNAAWNWWEIFFFPFVVILGAIVMFVFDFLMVLSIAGYCLAELIKTDRETLKSGKLTHPFLIYLGAVAALILFFLYVSSILDSNLPKIIYLVLSIGTFMIFTLLPLSALLIHGTAWIAMKIVARLANR